MAYWRGETVWTAVLLLLGLAAAATAFQLDVQRAHDPLGPRFFPLVTSFVLLGAVAAVAVRPLVHDVRRRGRPPPPEILVQPVSGGPPPNNGRTGSGPLGQPLIRVYLMAATCVGYVGLMHVMGYIVPTILSMLSALWILGVRRRRSLILAPVVSAFALYYIFSELLHVRLP